MQACISGFETHPRVATLALPRLLQLGSRGQTTHDGRDRCQWQRVHFNAIHRAWSNAQITACAFIDNHGVHKPGCAENGVHGAGLNAFGTTDALCFANEGNLRRCSAALQVQCQDRNRQQFGQLDYRFVAARWAFVDGFTASDTFGVRLAAGMAALAALSLRQEGVDTADEVHVGKQANQFSHGLAR